VDVSWWPWLSRQAKLLWSNNEVVHILQVLLEFWPLQTVFPLKAPWTRVKFYLQLLDCCLTGVNIWTLSVKLPMNVMIVMRWLSLSMRLNCIMNRSSSLRASRGFLSLSYCRRSFTSTSVGRKRIKHSTKSTRTVRRSNLNKKDGLLSWRTHSHLTYVQSYSPCIQVVNYLAHLYLAAHE